MREHSRHAQRVHKVLQDANLKLATVLSDVLGRSGRAILDALVAGESEPARLAALVSTRVKASRAELLDALRGTLTDDHRFTLRLHLELMDRLLQAVAALQRSPGVTHFRSSEVDHMTITIAAVIGERRDAVAA